MNQDTERSVKGILKNGYYRKHQTLGDGGWSKIPKDWKRYCLEAYQEDDESLFWNEIDFIVAKDDGTAIKAFHSLYHMDKFISYEIKEKVVTYRIVDLKE